MSFEIAFRVKPDTDFHKNYFRMQEEKEKFKTKAKAFFQEQGFEQPVTYGIAKRLHIRLSESDFAKFGSQCCSMPDRKGLYMFKSRSPIQTAWEKAVLSVVDMNLVGSFNFWWIDYISHGQYALWDHNGTIYGYLSDKNKNDPELGPDLEQIKLSEYYRIVEEVECVKA